MSLCDPYQEMELYLEQAHGEVSLALKQNNFSESVDEKNDYRGSAEDLSYISSLNSEPVISEFDTIISDLKELLTNFEKKPCVNKEVPDIIKAPNNGEDKNKSLAPAETFANITDVRNNENTSLHSYSTDLSMPLSYLSELNFVNTGTQTTSPSQSSTNLTWNSDCSASPYSSSESDIDAVSEDIRISPFKDDTQQARVRFRWQQELSSKSSSAPVLKNTTKVNKQARSQSDRHLSEIEATEACNWLRAAGFPQYAQMYEDLQFPVDIAAVEQDHPMLESAVLHSLFRRLQVLNRCTQIHQQKASHTNDSEDEQCALSNNWTYQKDVRRWSRCQDSQLPNLQDAENLLRSSNCPDQSDKQDSSRDKCRRRRRDACILSDSGSSVLDILSQQLSDFSTSDKAASKLESFTRRNSRRKTRSLDKSDTFSHLTNTTESDLWHTTYEAEEFENGNRISRNDGRPVSCLSCTQLQVLRKLALLKLTSYMEKYCPTHKTGWNWDISKFIRKAKCPVYKEKIIFGVPLTVILQRTGLPLPKGIEEALHWVKLHAPSNIGIFRKSGVRSRIQILKSTIENQGENINFTDHQAYDVADIVKLYFRELPEALLTDKLSETFISIFQHVPQDLRREAVICGLLLMPDEYREVLQVLLHFLSTVANHSSENQMNESNLALCFAPTLFHHTKIANRQGMDTPHPKELAENRAAQDCLRFLIENCNTLFTIPSELFTQCNPNQIIESTVVPLSALSVERNGDWRSYLQECQSALLKELKEKTRGWILVPSHFLKVEIAYKKVADGYPLRLWKVATEVEAPPGVVLQRILTERHIWDEELHSTKIISQLDNDSEVFQYTRRNILPLPAEDYCVIRNWRTDLPHGGCLTVEASVEHPDATAIPNSVRGIVLASRYLIEPSSSGHSRVVHLSRVDIRGKMPEWYHKNYGHISALHIFNIQNSFRKSKISTEASTLKHCH